MKDYKLDVRLSEITSAVNDVNRKFDVLSGRFKPENDLWDGSDLVRNWKISERTVATWRSNGLISYVQVNGKIWYPREAREAFLNRNLIQMKHGG
jgi:hypothetical protein